MKDKIVVAFGRMNPQTVGHGLLVKKVVDTAVKAKADHMVVLSATQDKKKNPLPVARKVFWAKKMFPDANIIAAGAQTRTIIEVAKSLSGKYKHLVVVGGSDRTEEYKTLLEKYNGKEYNFDSIEIVQAGERDPDADGAAGMSATKMRKAAVDGDVTSFKSGVSSNLKTADIKLLMREIRVGLGMNEQETTMKTFKEFVSKISESIELEEAAVGDFKVGDAVDVHYHDIQGKTKHGTANVDKATSAYVHIEHPSISGMKIKFHQTINGKNSAGEVGTRPGTQAGGHVITKSST